MRSHLVRLSFALTAVVLAAGLASAAGGVSVSPDFTTLQPPRILPSLTPTMPPLRPTASATPEAVRRQIVRPDGVYEGNFNSTPVEFLLNAELGQLFVFEVVTNDFDAVLEVYDSHDIQVAYDDDGGPGNMPYLMFIAPSTGQFRIKLRGYSDFAEGGYILRVNSRTDLLTLDEVQTVTFDGRETHIYFFEGERGDIVNIHADSNNRIDTTLTLLGPDGRQITYVDDFNGFDPGIDNLLLLSSGRYFIVHAPYSETAVGDVTLRLEKPEILPLGVEPIAIDPADSGGIFSFEVTAGEVYEITLDADSSVNGGLKVNNLDGVEVASIDFNRVEHVNLTFRAETTGSTRVIFSALNTYVINSAAIMISGGALAE